jgi:hypothetical protein
MGKKKEEVGDKNFQNAGGLNAKSYHCFYLFHKCWKFSLDILKLEGKLDQSKDTSNVFLNLMH